MIRGRHRILPVAIDRAVMLPSDLQRSLDQDDRSQYNLHSTTYAREDDQDRRRLSQPGENRDGQDAILSS